MSGHDRRTKEAAQLGAYHVMLTGSNGGSYYMNHRGRRQTIDCELRMGIVTFCPDGTWAMHEVHIDEATAAYELALSMRHQSKVSTLYKGRAVVSEPFDPNPRLARAIDAVPNDAPEKMALAKAWQDAGLGKPSKGEVEPGRFGEAMHLIYTHTRRFQPFAASAEPEPIVSAHVVGELAERMAALPSDLAEEARRNAAGLPPLSSLRITEADVEDWDRVLQIAETAQKQRQQEAIGVFNMARQVDGCLALLPEDIGSWTDRDLTLATAIVSAMQTEEITPTGATESSIKVELDLNGSKAGVKKTLKEKASNYGLDCPSKWDDLVSDPVLWAVLVAT
jgi:hypothetical protein